MIGEFAERLRSQSLCSATTTAAPPSRPVPGEMVPPPIAGDRGVFSVTGECVRDGQGLLCTAVAANPPGGVPLAQIRYMWYLDGVVQSTKSSAFMPETVSPGSHTVGVKAFTPSTIYTDILTIQVR